MSGSVRRTNDAPKTLSSLIVTVKIMCGWSTPKAPRRSPVLRRRVPEYPPKSSVMRPLRYINRCSYKVKYNTVYTLGVVIYAKNDVAMVLIVLCFLLWALASVLALMG